MPANLKTGVSIVIPTFGREEVLCETVARAAELEPEEILVVDQTRDHQPATLERLHRFEAGGIARRIVLPAPSIPRAMNTGLVGARGPVVLFLDDDVVPDKNLLAEHARAFASDPGIWAAVGQVLQPGEEPLPLKPGEPFRFNSVEPRDLDLAIACNFAVRRDQAIRIGGFDENFVMAAYCFETEFALRVLDSGGRVRFVPQASIRHLRAERGGTRAHGHHLTTASPAHSVGAHYFYLLRNPPAVAAGKSAARVLRAIRTRHHLARPWLAPVTMIAEIRGFVLARKLHAAGPRLLGTSDGGAAH